MEIHPTLWTYTADEYRGVYPLLDYIGLVGRVERLDDGTETTRVIKCTPAAAATIASVCAELPYEVAMKLLRDLTGWDVDRMTMLRVTDGAGSEFVAETPTDADVIPAAGSAETGGDILRERIDRLEISPDRMTAIEKAVLDGPGGVPRGDYSGPVTKVMFVECDGTGVPGRHEELAGVRGKQPDGSARTFEAKVGAVFAADHTADGSPLLTAGGEIYRDRRISYMGTTRKTEDFGPMLRRHALDNGLGDADAVVFLGDGAKWVWGIQERFFPGAITCVDMYHAIEHVDNLIEHVQLKGRSVAARRSELKDRLVAMLRTGDIQGMLDTVEAMPRMKGHEERFKKAKGYFQKNMDRMNYGVLTALGIFVGSGVIEAGAKVIVGNRMKCAGMHWSKENAENMIALRCAVRNGGFLDTYLDNHTVPSWHAA